MAVAKAAVVEIPCTLADERSGPVTDETVIRRVSDGLTVETVFDHSRPNARCQIETIRDIGTNCEPDE